VRHIAEQTPRTLAKVGDFRVPPLTVVSLARSGKTTALKTVFNHLREQNVADPTAPHPIFITFNGDSGFTLRDGESDMDAFLRTVAAALLPGGQKNAPADLVCPEATLTNYLATATGPVVLLVDELNQISQNLSQRLEKYLRDNFLDHKNRYICFSSHWLLDLARASSVAGLTDKDSPRTAIVLAVAQCDDMKSLQALVAPEALHPVEVALFCKLPGLIYAIKMEGFLPKTRFSRLIRNKTIPRPTEDLVEGFFREFCYGTGWPEMLPFERFTFLTTFRAANKEEQVEMLIWPLCYARPFLHEAGQVGLAELIQKAETNCMQEKQHDFGLAWEFTALVGVGMVAGLARYRDLTKEQKRVIGPVPLGARPNVHYVEIPHVVLSVGDAVAYLTKYCAQPEVAAQAALLVAWPQNPQFEEFDSITCFKFANSLNPTFFRGQQMKLNKGKPKKPAPPKVPGVLLRGRAPKDTPAAGDGHANWDYLCADAVQSFCPVSLWPLLPSEWPELTEF
jgi:hypothetical protein